MSSLPRENKPEPDVIPCRIVSKPEEVAARLRELSIPPEVIREVRASWARGESSVNHYGPKNGAGMESWIRAIETLREMLDIEGWTPIDLRGIAPYIQSPDGAIALTVSSGDEGTGVRHLNPMTKNTKGIVVVEAVKRNWEQLVLNFGEQKRAMAASRPKKLSARMTMILLMNTVRIRRPNEPVQVEYRFELSTPAVMRNRRISEWSERILFPVEIGGGGVPTVERAPELPPDIGMTPEPNVTVSRKKSA